MTPDSPLAQARRHAEQALIERAEQDPDFRALLKADPHAALRRMLGSDPIPGIKITVVEETAQEITLVLPAALDTAELPDDMLDLVSGGICFSSFVLFDNLGPAKPKS